MAGFFKSIKQQVLCKPRRGFGAISDFTDFQKLLDRPRGLGEVPHFQSEADFESEDNGTQWKRICFISSSDRNQVSYDSKRIFRECISAFSDALLSCMGREGDLNNFELTREINNILAYTCSIQTACLKCDNNLSPKLFLDGKEKN